MATHIECGKVEGDLPLRWSSKRYQERKRVDDERRTKFDIKNLDRSSDGACVSQVHVSYELRGYIWFVSSETVANIQKSLGTDLVIGQQRRLTLPRQTLRQLPQRGVILDEMAEVVLVALRRGGVPLEIGRIRAPARRVHDVLVHREVIPAAVPEPVPRRATVRAPRGLRLLRRREREARVAPLLGWRRERVRRGRRVRVRRGSGRAALRCEGSWGWVSAAGVVIAVVVMSVGVVVVVMVAAAVATVCPMPVAAAIGRRVISAVTTTTTRVRVFRVGRGFGGRRGGRRGP
jgi:hypothetical protein